MEPREEIVSTMSNAGWPALFMLRRTSAIWLVTPVDVSLWTTITALMEWFLSWESLASTSAGEAPRRQFPETYSTSIPIRRAMSRHKLEKCPVSNISTRSPGESVLTMAASHAPEPEDGYITTAPAV